MNALSLIFNGEAGDQQGFESARPPIDPVLDAHSRAVIQATEQINDAVAFIEIKHSAKPLRRPNAEEKCTAAAPDSCSLQTASCLANNHVVHGANHIAVTLAGRAQLCRRSGRRRSGYRPGDFAYWRGRR
jgi:hypothetical protein